MKILLPLAALAAGFLVAPSAYAQNDVRIVHVADLQLDTADGVAKFDRRLSIAVRDVCGTTASYDRAGRKAIERCRIDTRNSIAAQRNVLVASARQTIDGGVSLADATAR